MRHPHGKLGWWGVIFFMEFSERTTPIIPSQSSPEKGTEATCQDPSWHSADPQTGRIIDVAQVGVTAADRMCHPDAIHVRGFTDRGAHLGDSRDSRVGINVLQGIDCSLAYGLSLCAVLNFQALLNWGQFLACVTLQGVSQIHASDSSQQQRQKHLHLAQPWLSGHRVVTSLHRCHRSR